MSLHALQFVTRNLDSGGELRGRINLEVVAEAWRRRHGQTHLPSSPWPDFA